MNCEKPTESQGTATTKSESYLAFRMGTSPGGLFLIRGYDHARDNTALVQAKNRAKSSRRCGTMGRKMFETLLTSPVFHNVCMSQTG